ncbi:hypothetical protein [Magnetococcus sp. PR-3]|uniref:hypothetical protein n=1 Tax=Magnetococcus sp. PR-3 TaxID=3120355 RepID=UPI002FCDF92D
MSKICMKEASIIRLMRHALYELSLEAAGRSSCLDILHTLNAQLPDTSCTQNLVEQKCEVCTFPDCVVTQELMAVQRALSEACSAKDAERVFYINRLYGYQRYTQRTA